MYFLGYDIGSSSVKASLVEAESLRPVVTVHYPEVEMDIISLEIGWAEQHPEIWWENLCQATHLLFKENNIDPKKVKGIGISYQMHGLVLVDEALNVLRPSIIWCDSRAVEIGNDALAKLTAQKCLPHLLNSPGNFTASKLKWVMDNEPEVYERIKYIMLPGDFINMKLTGEVNTTISGLSEGIFWDFQEQGIAQFLLDHYKISKDLIPSIVPTCSIQGRVHQQVAERIGVPAGTPVCYRAGDQPNNAMSLGVLKPNEVAATGGTSGVIYGVADKLVYDNESRINSFAHVNYTMDNPKVGVLLCINGAGIQYAWLKKQMAPNGIGYEDMERMMSEIPVGAAGLRILPFGNGAERVLCNRNTGAQINNLHFNRHSNAHVYRAAIEGIAFSFVYGFQVMKELGMQPAVIRAGNDNLFQSQVFSTTIANLLNCPIEIVKTTGSIGAAKACSVALGEVYEMDDAFRNNVVEKIYHPADDNEVYKQAYHAWGDDLNRLITT